MTPLPTQHPQRRRPVALRPRNDHPRLPTFRAPMTPRVVEQPRETYDPRNEARPFEWRELRDPKLWLSSGLAVALGVIALIVVLSSGPTPA